VREKEKMIQALSWELDQMRRLKEEQVSELQNQARTLQQVAKVCHDDRASEHHHNLTSHVECLIGTQVLELAGTQPASRSWREL
jgi:hypothetical protein